MAPRAPWCLEPVIGDASAVARQIFERVESIEVIDGHLRHGFGFGKTQVDRDASASLLVLLPRAPERDAAAGRTEVELDCVTSNVGLRLAGHLDALALVVIRPQHAVAPAYRAITGSCSVGLAFELPSNGAAVTGPLDHLACLLIEVDSVRRIRGGTRPLDRRYR